jgi:DNA transformation protein
MAFSPEFRDHVLDLMAPLAHVEAKRMFGGVGYFYRDLMFALQAREELYFKVDAASQEDFEAAGSGPFTYLRGGKERALGSYWRVPDEVMDDEEDFLAWARRATEAALAADRAKAAKRKA